MGLDVKDGWHLGNTENRVGQVSYGHWEWEGFAQEERSVLGDAGLTLWQGGCTSDQLLDVPLISRVPWPKKEFSSQEIKAFLP